jgi:hypothetical protein
MWWAPQEFDMKYFPVLITTLTVQSAAVLFAPALAQTSQPRAVATVSAETEALAIPSLWTVFLSLLVHPPLCCIATCSRRIWRPR